MFDRLQKKLTTVFVRPYVTWYLKQTRISSIKGFKLIIKPGVFHPRFFFSTGYLFDFIDRLALSEKKILEIGCGSGLISLLAYKKNADVTCSDINPTAIECARLNFSKNFSPDFLGFNCLESDLFENIPQKTYDIIVINPPYFFEDAVTEGQFAWNCGKNGEYFKTLFSGIKNYMHAYTAFYMILADNCDIARIKEIALTSHLMFNLVEKKKIRWETNFIFKITQPRL